MERLAWGFGLTPDATEEMTIAELKEYVEAVNKQKRADRKIEAEIAYIQASLTIRMLNGDKKLPPLNEAFPGIWTQKEIDDEKIRTIQQRMMAWQNKKVVKKSE